VGTREFSNFDFISKKKAVPGFMKMAIPGLNPSKRRKENDFSKGLFFFTQQNCFPQSFLKPFSNMFAFIAKSLCKRYYIFLCLSLFLLASKPFTAVTKYQGSLFLFYISGFLVWFLYAYAYNDFCFLLNA